MKILSLDGGGINGILQLAILAKLKIRPEDFDLIAGTSIGAINASALRIGMQPIEMIMLFMEHGGEIFPPYWKRALSGRPLSGLIRSRYSSDALRGILRDVFGDKLMGQANGKLLLTACDMMNGDFVAMKSWSTNEYGMLIREACMSSAAAPVYFPSNGRYVDGGIAANHPGDVAKAEAIQLGAKQNKIEIVSVGCGYNYEAPSKWTHGMGALPFGFNVLEMFMRSQVRKTHNVLKRELGNRYKRYNVRFKNASGKMDDASKKNIEALLKDAENVEEVD